MIVSHPTSHRPRAARVVLALVAALALLAGLAPSGAAAQRGRRRPTPAATPDAEGPTGPQPTVRDIDTIAARLSSTNGDEVREAIDLLSVIDHPSVVPHLATLLRSGRSDEVTDRALQALRGLAHPSAIEVLGEFAHHRRPRARRLAYQALAAVSDRRVPALLEQGLSDSDRSVRAQCARSLGEIGATGSVETLFVAFDRGIVEAAISIGKLGNRASIPRFHEYLGRVPLSVMLSGYAELVRRNDIPDDAKIEIIGRLGEISGDMVRVFLQRYLDTLPTGRTAERDRVRLAVIETLRRIPGHAGSARGTTVSTGAEGTR
ncbi:MAG: HEAT repeat domain-containing protein [Sandaracinaceae bacterium]|nr:HEAT repeat domain-containing protein [Sandaracinaceae bacterium]